MSKRINDLAESLVDSDARLLKALVESRKRQGLSVEEVSRRMGVSEDEVREFEYYWADPSLSVVRRYALAVGSMVRHTITITIPEENDAASS